MELWGLAVGAGALVVTVGMVTIFLRRARLRREVVGGYGDRIARLDTSYEALRRGLGAYEDEDHEQALELGYRVTERPSKGHYRPAASHALVALAAAKLGKYRTAQHHASAALRYGAVGDLMPSQSTLLSTLACAELELCRLDEAVEFAAKAAAGAGEASERAEALRIEGTAHLLSGADRRARVCAEAALEFSAGPSQQAATEHLLGRIAISQGAHDQGAAHLDRAAELLSGSGGGVQIAHVLMDQADLAELRGEKEAALDIWRAAFRVLARHPQDHQGLAIVYLRMAGALADAGDHAQADGFMAAAESEFAHCELPAAPMLLAWMQARIATSRNERSAAVSALANSLYRAERLGLRYWQRRITADDALG